PVWLRACPLLSPPPPLVRTATHPPLPASLRAVLLTTGASAAAAGEAAPAEEAPAASAEGADMPYTTVEAEDGTAGGGAQVVGPNRTIGDPAGEASGRQAVTLEETGQYVEFTAPVETNTLVTRFSIPDGEEATLNVYI